MRLEFHPEAEQELIEAAVYYDQQVPGLGERFLFELQRATDLLLEHPEIGVELGSHLRRIPLHRFPFAIIYTLSPGILLIMAVAHGSRRPGYWRYRT